MASFSLRAVVPGLVLTLSALTAASCGGSFDAGKGSSNVSPGGECSPDGETAPAADGCNTCTCSEGSWACTKRACVEDGGSPQECAPGTTRPAGDGCNSCSCTEAGTWACTRTACPEPQCTNGETMQADCNICTCMSGSWGCTLMDCNPPPQCADGETREVDCNTCTCMNGSWGCTAMACPPPEECKPGETTTDGCNECTCAGGRWACTDRACPPPPQCEEGTSRDDGCNLCMCTGGLWSCTLRYCPPAMDAGSGHVSCGGWLGDTCGETEYCAYEEGQHCGAADASSVCLPRPEGCDDVYDPVCGCDGVTYSNSCEAAVKGTGVLRSGSCATLGLP